MSSDLVKLEELIQSVKKHHTALYEDSKKKACTDCRKSLQSIVEICKQMRKDVLEHRKGLPVKKRAPKKSPTKV